MTQSFLAVVLLLLISESLPSGQQGCAGPPGMGDEDLSRAPAALQGFWRDRDDPNYSLAVEGTRLIIGYGERAREVGALLKSEGEQARICYSGREITALLRYQKGELVFRDPFRERTHRMMKLPERLAGLCLTSLRLPDPRPLPETRVREIQREIYEHRQQEQALLRPSKRSRPAAQEALPWLQTQSVAPPEGVGLSTEIQMADRFMKNTEYLRELIAEVGWIDVERFGQSASDAAFLLVQHSWDVPLMLAVLPRLKRDVDAGRMGSDTYALLYDRLQLALGLPQRYGTQIGRDAQGEAVVLPVEDSAHVEELRRQLGLIPLAEYVKVFGASEVRFSMECQRR